MAIQGAYLTGSLPRSPELIRATRAHDRGRMGESDLLNAETQDTVDDIAMQLREGLGFVSNPQVNWQDLFRPLLPALEGVDVGPLTRWFDNNTFYRQPVVTDLVRRQGSIEDRLLAIEHLPADHPWKATLPGPWTFMTLCDNRAYPDSDDLLIDLAVAIGEAARGLVAAGFAHVQFSEPSLVVSPPLEGDWDAATEAIGRATRGVDATTSVQTYFGDASSALPGLDGLPVDIVGLDLYATDLDAVDGGSLSKAIALGCVDARNSLVENAGDLVSFATQALDRLDPGEAYLTPSCDLEFLPRGIAEKKVRSLAQATHDLRGDA